MGLGTELGIEILGWDFWAAQHQRHFCQSLRATNDFLQNKWGVPEYRDFRKFARDNFSSLTLFPLIEREMSDDRPDVARIGDHVGTLLSKHPELVSPGMWEYCSQETVDSIPHLGVVSPATWFHPVLPFGTNCNFVQRYWGFPRPDPNSDYWPHVLALSPNAFVVQVAKIWDDYHGKPPVAAVDAAFKPSEAFRLDACERLAEAHRQDPAAYEQIMQHVCEFDPGAYFDLGDWYLDRKDEVKAAEAYRHAVDLAEDRIQVANSCGWLVDYLDDHGEKEKALAIATEAAEVYSYDGLETMARLQEKHGHLKEAEDFLKKLAERYEGQGSGPITSFYLRNADKDPAYKAAGEKILAQTFPQGITKVAIADFKEPPKDGAIMTSSSGASIAAGIQQGDVIVAIDGYLVHSQAQYVFARGMSIDPTMHLILWNPRGYREITHFVRGRRFHTDLANYHGK